MGLKAHRLIPAAQARGRLLRHEAPARQRVFVVKRDALEIRDQLAG
jgi:hypothetical protein